MDVLVGSSMPVMAGLILVASRGTTNSNPSLETRVMYLLEGVAEPFVISAMAGKILQSHHQGKLAKKKWKES